eukprot:m.67350 g.67350  ORF g.67350 m.67350 type:complete len:521 (+) comp23799_c0_seq2:145-1707(+)
MSDDESVDMSDGNSSPDNFDSDVESNDFEDDVEFAVDKDSSKDDNVEIEILSASDLIQTQIDAIEEINAIFQIPPQTARNLLHHFNWDKERLLERYYGASDIDALYKEAHCVNPSVEAQQQLEKANATTSKDEEPVCDICLCNYADSKFSKVNCCGSAFCNECWGGHLETQIVDLGKAYIACPAMDCDKLIDELTVTKLITDKKTLSKYQTAIARVFVQGNKRVKFCPAPNCEHAIRVSSVAAFPVTCKCGHKFCFKCCQPPHDPVRCEMLHFWLKKCEDDSETSNWIAANTKECPKCRATIEKNGGCNHMTCNNSSCKYDFCWFCLGPWEPHGSSWYNCNKFDDKDSVAARDAESQSRATLERYLFYFNRYANHMNSIKLEAKLKEIVEMKMNDIQKSTGMSWIEVQFLAKAVETLRRCRTVLMYTYVFAFFLNKNTECNIFEDNQKNLELSVETLSGYLEREQLAMKSVDELRQKVLDKSKYCESRRQVLLDHVNEGVEKNSWDYQPAKMVEIMERLL